MTIQERLDILKQQLRQQEFALCQLQGAIAVCEAILEEQNGSLAESEVLDGD